MKTIAILALLAASPVAAQSIDSDNSAVSGSESNSQTYGSVHNNIVTHQADKIRTTANASIGGFSGSFSPDSCTSTAGGSVGVTGWGISVGGPKANENCERMRVIERGGQIASQGKQMGFDGVAAEVYMLNVWVWCTSRPDLAEHCKARGLVVGIED